MSLQPASRVPTAPSVLIGSSQEDRGQTADSEGRGGGGERGDGRGLRPGPGTQWCSSGLTPYALPNYMAP